MAQLIKKTLIIKDVGKLKTAKPVFGMIKLQKNSLFKACFSLKNLDLDKNYSAAIISSNMPINFVEIKSAEFETNLPVEIAIDDIAVIIFAAKSITPVASSSCDDILFLGYLDTIKKLRGKSEFLVSKKEPEFFNNGEPIEIIGGKENKIKQAETKTEEPVKYVANLNLESAAEQTEFKIEKPLKVIGSQKPPKENEIKQAETTAAQESSNVITIEKPQIPAEPADNIEDTSIKAVIKEINEPVQTIKQEPEFIDSIKKIKAPPAEKIIEEETKNVTIQKAERQPVNKIEKDNFLDLILKIKDEPAEKTINKTTETFKQDIKIAEETDKEKAAEDLSFNLSKNDYGYIDEDVLLQEDSTLGDNLKISDFNYYESEKNPSDGKKMIKPFYESVKAELDELFNKHDREILLEKMISQSKFCKIMYEENKYYVVGLIFEDNVPVFICYGIPTYNSKEPPKELRGFSSYIPTNPDNLKDLGYWLMYQNAETGETIFPD